MILDGVDEVTGRANSLASQLSLSLQFLSIDIGGLATQGYIGYW